MKSGLLIPCVLAVMSSRARAEQCMVMREDVASKADTLIREFGEVFPKEFLSFCQICGDTEAKAIPIPRYEVTNWNQGLWQLLPEGENWPLDLAYLYLPEYDASGRPTGRAVNVGKQAGCLFRDPFSNEEFPLNTPRVITLDGTKVVGTED